jgi:replicative DNA helicase
MAEFILAKHRNGSVGTVNLRFRKEQARFLDYDADTAHETFSYTDSSMGAGGGSSFGGAADGGFGGGLASGIGGEFDLPPAGAPMTGGTIGGAQPKVPNMDDAPF